MKNLLFTLSLALCFLCGAHAQTTYYLSASGNDANDGLVASRPWLTPNHAISCGDVILAAPSTSYSYKNFASGKWGRVSCGQQNNVAWLKCAKFDACKIATPSGVQAFGMSVSSSFWGVQGWEISVLGRVTNGLSCFNAQPPDNTASIHHIIFANNIANVCDLAGFGVGSIYNGTTSVDYVAILGNISYKAGTSNTGCGSGIGVYQPAAVDHNPGTHIYVSGNLSYASTNPTVGCWDANGISFDTFDGHSGMPHSYYEQAVIDNNLAIGNEGVGLRVEYNDSGNGPAHSHIYVRNNTAWGNSVSQSMYGSPDCGELRLEWTVNTTAYQNLLETTQPGCYGADWNPNAAISARYVDTSSQVMNNWANSNTGTNLQVRSGNGFSFGLNIVGVEPWLADPYVPGPPACGSFADVPSCMANVVNHLKPRLGLAKGFGYQAPQSVSKYDPLFPQWLCSASLPPGLVTMGCSAN